MAPRRHEAKTPGMLAGERRQDSGAEAKKKAARLIDQGWHRYHGRRRSLDSLHRSAVAESAVSTYGTGSTNDRWFPSSASSFCLPRAPSTNRGQRRSALHPSTREVLSPWTPI